MKFKRPNSLQSWLFSSAALLLFLMALLWTVMEILAAHEQARTPGERNLGVAVIWMTFQIPIWILEFAGVGCLILGALVFAYRRILTPKPK